MKPHLEEGEDGERRRTWLASTEKHRDHATPFTNNGRTFCGDRAATGNTKARYAVGGRNGCELANRPVGQSGDGRGGNADGSGGAISAAAVARGRATMSSSSSESAISPEGVRSCAEGLKIVVVEMAKKAAKIPTMIKKFRDPNTVQNVAHENSNVPQGWLYRRAKHRLDLLSSAPPAR